MELTNSVKGKPQVKVINHLSFFLFEWNGAVDRSKKISKC